MPRQLRPRKHFFVGWSAGPGAGCIERCAPGRSGSSNCRGPQAHWVPTLRRPAPGHGHGPRRVHMLKPPAASAAAAPRPVRAPGCVPGMQAGAARGQLPPALPGHGAEQRGALQKGALQWVALQRAPTVSRRLELLFAAAVPQVPVDAGVQVEEPRGRLEGQGPGGVRAGEALHQVLPAKGRHAEDLLQDLTHAGACSLLLRRTRPLRCSWRRRQALRGHAAPAAKGGLGR
jgi:hypothetical protein